MYGLECWIVYTLSWAHKQFTTPTHTSSSMKNLYCDVLVQILLKFWFSLYLVVFAPEVVDLPCVFYSSFLYLNEKLAKNIYVYLIKSIFL